MAQIAERAGVALSTVSYVLSGKRSVSQHMRERVLAAIEEASLDQRFEALEGLECPCRETWSATCRLEPLGVEA